MFRFFQYCRWMAVGITKVMPKRRRFYLSGNKKLVPDIECRINPGSHSSEVFSTKIDDFKGIEIRSLIAKASPIRDLNHQGYNVITQQGLQYKFGLPSLSLQSLLSLQLLAFFKVNTFHDSITL